jgi:hypothetical protein
MGNKLTPKVILEGTRLTFKTEIAFELNELPRILGPRKYRYHSPFPLAGGTPPAIELPHCVLHARAREF